MIQPPNEFDVPIWKITSEVSRFIESRAWSRTERIGNELLRGQFRMVQITARQTISANINLTGQTHRNRLLVLVQQIELRVGKRTTDGARSICTAQRPCGVSGGFRRAIKIVNLPNARRLINLFHQLDHQRLACKTHSAH